MNTEVQPIEVLLVTAKQAAQMLNVSERTVFNLAYAGHLSSVKIRGSRRFHSDELKRLAVSGTEEIRLASEGAQSAAAEV